MSTTPARDEGNPPTSKALAEFTASVIDIREESRAAGRIRWQLLLSNTAFAPGNTGTLEAVARSGARLLVPVLSVHIEAAGDRWHLVEKPLSAGTSVTGRVSG